MSVGLRDLMREPVVHFVLIGAALFALDRAVNPDDAVPVSTERGGQEPIVVDDELRAALIESWERTHPKPPTPEELGEMIERWVDQEVLYREGLRRGLADHDPQVRDRVAGQMQYALEQGLAVPEPTEAQLQVWFEDHADALRRPGRLDFTQVFVEGEDEAAVARANELLVLLQDGAAPAGLGDRFAGGRRFRGRKLADIADRFGEAFASGLDTEPLEEWTLRRSSFGQHLVRLDRAVAGSAPKLDAVRAEVVHGWLEEQRAQRLAEATLALREGWTVVTEP